jgi:hypothetical protein
LLNGWRAASSFSLEAAFRLQKATSKLSNDAFYFMFFCQIKKLPWSDPGWRRGSPDGVAVNNRSSRARPRTLRFPRTSALLKSNSYFFSYLLLSARVMSRADIGNACQRTRTPNERRFRNDKKECFAGTRRAMKELVKQHVSQ